MSTEQKQRPNFFEGQYLGARDLDLAVEYNRFQQARHALGAHTWGVAVGLELIEQEAAGGGVEAVLQPGFAVDGYGRQICVSQPHRLTPEVFESITGPTSIVRVKLWLHFLGQHTSSPGDLYRVCENEQQFARLQEGFGIAAARVGAFDHADEHEPILVAGQSRHALDLPLSRTAGDPIHCDESVPYQTFPSTEEDPERTWLVPLGYLRWNIAQHRLEAAEESEKRLTRVCRRYMGAVSEEILAPDGLIRIRNRQTPSPPDPTTPLHEPCDASRLSEDEGVDITLDAATGVVSTIDLVWIEGHLRLIGDEKIYGGKVDLRERDGKSNGAPLWIQRVDPNKASGSPAGKDLQVVIGESKAGRNRFAVGPLKQDQAVDAEGNLVPVKVLDDKFVVLDNGHVGIQVPAPEAPEHDLQIGAGEEQVSLALRGTNGDEKSSVLAFENKSGMAAGWMQFVYNTMTGRLSLNSAELDPNPIITFVAADGHVGIDTDDPWRPLTVRGEGVGEELIGFEGLKADGSVDRKWHINQRLSGFRDGLNFAETNVKDGRLFLKAGGKVGVNTVEPNVALHVVEGTDVGLNDGRGHLMLGTLESTNVVMDHREIQARNNRNASDLHVQSAGGDLVIHSDAGASVVRVKDNGRVGVGSGAPRSKMEVRGEIRLASDGNDFAVSARQSRIRIVAGRVSGAGVRLGGDQFTSMALPGSAHYLIVFDLPFEDIPSVVVTPIDAADEDRVMTVVNLSLAQFQVFIKDVAGPGEGDQQANPFSFIAVGRR